MQPDFFANSVKRQAYLYDISSSLQTWNTLKIPHEVSPSHSFSQSTMSSMWTIFVLSNLPFLLLVSLHLGNVSCLEVSGAVGSDEAESTTEITAGRQINLGPAAEKLPTPTTMGTRRRELPTSGATYRQSARRYYGNVSLVVSWFVKILCYSFGPDQELRSTSISYTIKLRSDRNKR